MKSVNLPRKATAVAALCATLALSPFVQAESDIMERSFCVFDPVGANGPLFAITKTFQPVALHLHAVSMVKISAAQLLRLGSGAQRP